MNLHATVLNHLYHNEPMKVQMSEHFKLPLPELETLIRRKGWAVQYNVLNFLAHYFDCMIPDLID